MSQLQIVPFELERHEVLIQPLTELLHLCYKPLAERGMRYLATHQSAKITRERLLSGDSFLGFAGDRLVSTVTLKFTMPDSLCAWYRKPEVFHFSQFAVHPEFQGQGIGSSIMDMLELRARELGAKELALDTSEHADNLISMYSKRGYRHVDMVQWSQTNYLSVILSKDLHA